MTTTKFEEHRYPVEKNLPCPTCGKKVKRTRTFTGTSNPFTEPPYMPYAQMREKLRAEMDAWSAQPVTCAACERDAAPAEAEPVAESWPSDPERTTATFNALVVLREIATLENLPVNGVTIEPARGQRFDHVKAEMVPSLTTIRFTVRGVRELAAWCAALGIDGAVVERRPGSCTDLRVVADVVGFCWTILATYSLPLAIDAAVEWNHGRGGKRENAGRMKLADLAALPERDREVTR